jgi:asparagine synthase (glutamine-hydrolysing)
VRRTLITAGDRLPSDRHSRVLNLLRLTKGFLASADLPFEAPGPTSVFPRRPGNAAAQRDGAARRNPCFRASSDDALNRMLAVDAERSSPTTSCC